MAKNTQKNCFVCTTAPSKYTCSGCMVPYCSVACFKEHKASSCTASPRLETDEPAETLLPSVTDTIAGAAIESSERPAEPPLEPAKPLRALSTLKWPYVPEESAFPDPLKRNDPKQLQTRQYEAIAMSPKIRQLLTAHPSLRALLTSLDTLRGPERELAFQRALGVTAPQITMQVHSQSINVPLEEDVIALRAFAEAVEGAVRGTPDELGLDWGEP